MAGGAGKYISSTLNAIPRSDLTLIIMWQNTAGLKPYKNSTILNESTDIQKQKQAENVFHTLPF